MGIFDSIEGADQDTMRDLMNQLANDLLDGQTRIVCQVVETRGSTPQKAGAYMMIAPDGQQWGTLGGGCVENEVKSRSLMTLQPDQCLVSSYVLDHDYAWADGLICGGKMIITSQKFETRDSKFMDYAKAWARLDEMGHGFREAIVQHASDLIQTILGQRFLVDHLGQLAGFWPEPPTMDQLELVRNSKATLQRPVTVSGVSVIQWPQRIQVVIVGAGHVGQAVAELAQRANFEVVVVDDRAQFANFDRFPKATEIHVGPFQEILTNIEITSRTYLLIVTRGHGHDQEALGLVAATPAAYVGLIGSRRKIKMITESLHSEGLASDSLARVKAPIGLPIGSQTIFEIAVSVVAEMIAWRNLGESDARKLGGPSAHLIADPSANNGPPHTRAEVV